MPDLSFQLGFTGAYNVKVDDKGRIIVPSEIAKVLNTRYASEAAALVLSISLEGSITAQPFSLWEKRANKLEELDEMDVDARRIRSMTMAFTYQSSIDSNNRLRIPRELSDLFGIEKEATVIGQRDHFQIWNRETWEKHSAESVKGLLEAAARASANAAARRAPSAS
ncbi:MAG: cell division protein MraZ [candidate division BRC1 bacterium ADurb.BinA364]|nr:MAG: cell division protein MraZ [candidate division BRC1 bacterium ADurb.BinA364]